MEIRPVSAAVGAEVHGVDLRSVEDSQLSEIDQAWAKYGVLFFRDQQLSPEDHIAFAERLAPIDVNQFFQPVDGHPRVAEVRKEPDQRANIGGGWHTDHTYDQIPARGSILVAREVPPYGGDTRYASVAAAYEALSDGMKEMLLSLDADHSNAHIFGAESKHAREVGHRLANPDRVGTAVHPVVVKHPSTGQPLLYVNGAFTTNFVGWTKEESAPILSHLFGHVGRPEFSYQFRWEPGAVAMWDNRSTWHWALNDYHGHRRLMHRITIAGEPLERAAAPA